MDAIMEPTLLEPFVTFLTDLGVVFPSLGIMKVIFGAVVVLSLATVLTLILQKRKGKAKTAELTARILGWWIIFGFLTPVLFGPPVVGVIVLALIAFLALREYASIMPLRAADRWALALAYLAVPVQTWFIINMQYGFFIILVPVYLFMILPVALVLMGETQRFIVSLGTLHWGVMMAVYALGHAAFLLMLPEMRDGPSGAGDGLGLLLLLFIITGGNDVAQYCWGKLLGRHKIVPQVSPNKTWEGFLCGV
ncbi:MAG: phosphatidate cytidylyltransferase, partial [Pseudomonadota bacterium]